MTQPTKSLPAKVIAVGYLLLTLAVASPLALEGYIGHGNGLEFLVTLALTSPLSVVLLLLSKSFLGVYGTGWTYFVILCYLGAGALVNARFIYWLVARLTTVYRG